MEKILISGPKPQSAGGVSSFVDSLVTGLQKKFDITHIHTANIYSALKSTWKSTKVIILNSNNLLPLLLLILFLPRPNPPRIYFVVHGEMGKELKFSLKKLFLIGCQHVCLRSADKVIFVSNMLCNDYLAVHGTKYKRKSIVIHNGIDIDPERLRSFKAKKDGLIIYAGGNRDEKGISLIENLLNDKEFKPTRPLHLMLVGCSDASYTIEGITISTHKFMPRAEFIEALREAEIFLSPSKYETFGIALTEAYIFNCKVVTYEKNGALELLLPQDSIFTFNNYSYQSFVSALNLALNSSPPKSKSYSSNLSTNNMIERYAQQLNRDIER